MAAKGYAKLYLKEPVSLWSLLPYLQMMPKVASRFALRPSPQQSSRIKVRLTVGLAWSNSRVQPRGVPMLSEFKFIDRSEGASIATKGDMCGMA